jgi:hypothetical protein
LRRPTNRAPFAAALILLFALSTPGLSLAAPAAKRPGASARPPRAAAVAPKGSVLPDSHVLATIGSRRITVYDFRYNYYLSDATLRPMPDSTGRVQFLHDLIGKEILGQAALQTSYQLSFADRAELRDFRSTVLSNALFSSTKDTTPISEDSLRKVASYYARDLRLKLLYFPTREQAEEMRRELIAGRLPWSVAQARYGLHTSTVINGTSGWIKFANLPIEIALPIWSLRLAQISPIIPASSGYHVAQIAEERFGKAPAYVGMRRSIKTQLHEVQGRARRLAIQEEAKQGMDVVYDSTNVVWAASFFRAARHVETEGLGTNLIFDPNVPEFTPEDTARTMVKWKGGRLSLGTIVHEYTDIQPLVRPSLNTPENMIGFIDAVMLGPKMTTIAEQRGLDKDSTVVQQLEHKREGMLVEHMIEDSVLTHISVTPEERRAYYDHNRERFISYPRVRFGVLIRSSKAGADSALQAIQHGTSFESLLARDKANGIAGSDTSEISSEDSHPQHKVLFEELHPGKATIIGPDKDKIYGVLYEKSYDEGHLVPYEQMEGTIDESVRNMKGDAAVQAFIQRLESRFPVVAHDDEVMRFTLTDPTVDTD